MQRLVIEKRVPRFWGLQTMKINFFENSNFAQADYIQCLQTNVKIHFYSQSVTLIRKSHIKSKIVAPGMIRNDVVIKYGFISKLCFQSSNQPI